MSEQLSYEDFLKMLDGVATEDAPDGIKPPAIAAKVEATALGGRFFAYVHEFHYGTANPWIATEEQAANGVSLMERFPDKLEIKIGCVADEIAYACAKVLRAHPDVMPFTRKMIAAKAVVVLWEMWRMYLGCQDKHIIERLCEAVDSTHSEIEDKRLHAMFDEKLKVEIHVARGFEQASNAEAGVQWKKRP
jgi:hypothetical protein